MQRNFPVAINQQGFFGRNIRPAMQRTGQFLKGSFGIRPLIAGTGTYMLSDDILTKLGVTGPLKTAINFGAGALGVTPAGRIIGYGYSGLKGLAALADKVRKDADDWDFSPEGRLRQSLRMKSIADFESLHNRIVICDFVCPTEETRQIFDADITIWLDTIDEGRFEDTNALFEKPSKVDFHITEWNDHNHSDVAEEIKKDV